jgi:hypothetical protein
MRRIYRSALIGIVVLTACFTYAFCWRFGIISETEISVMTLSECVVVVDCSVNIETPVVTVLDVNSFDWGQLPSQWKFHSLSLKGTGKHAKRLVWAFGWGEKEAEILRQRIGFDGRAAVPDHAIRRRLPSVLYPQMESGDIWWKRIVPRIVYGDDYPNIRPQLAELSVSDGVQAVFCYENEKYCENRIGTHSYRSPSIPRQIFAVLGIILFLCGAIIFSKSLYRSGNGAIAAGIIGWFISIIGVFCFAAWWLDWHPENAPFSLGSGASAPCYSLPEDIRVLPVVVAPLELSHVFGADVVEAAHDAALQQRPDAVDGLGMDDPPHVFAPMVADGLMREVVGQAGVTAVFVGGDEANLLRHGQAAVPSGAPASAPGPIAPITTASGRDPGSLML